MLFIKSLSLTNFKNYYSLQISFDKKFNAITGLNGLGKTNLIDAIYYLAMTKSNFVSDSNVVLQNKGFFRLEGNFIINEKPTKIVAKVKPRISKVVEKNGAAYGKLSQHIGLIPIVMISPDDLQIVTQGSESRRKIMDQSLSQIHKDYLSALISYNKILNQRNSYLKSNLKDNTPVDHQLLDILDQQLHPHADIIFTHRKEFTKSLADKVSITYNAIANNQEVVSLQYNSSLKKDSLSNLLSTNRQKDLILGRTTVGIHKDDLVFKINDTALKVFASQGQLKSFLIALKIVQYQIIQHHTQINPILLLDDIFEKLDKNRLTNLMTLLTNDNFGQTFITNTSADQVQEIFKNINTPFKLIAIDPLTAQNPQTNI